MAFLNSSGPGDAVITQDLGTLIAGETYVISIAVATRGPSNATPQATYRLGVATGGSAAAPAYNMPIQVSGTAPANPFNTSDNWALQTLVFTPTTTADWYTYISDDGASGGGLAQLLVDAPVPEPASLLLLGTVLLLLGRVFRRPAMGRSD